MNNEHKVGDVLLGYQGFPGSKKEILGVIKSITNGGVYCIKWMDDRDSESFVGIQSIPNYKRNLKVYLAKSQTG